MLGIVIQISKKLTRDSSYINVMPSGFSDMSVEKRFEYIYETGHWLQTDTESLSGAGSSIEFTETYRPQIASLIKKMEFDILFDAPCGDFNWMSKVIPECQIEYIGGDIVKSLIETNKKKYNNIRFIHFDITRDKFVTADAWHCRDCLFHLSFADVLLALENFDKSDIEYALLTTHKLPEGRKNKDIISGDFRPLDLTIAPFCLPEPLELLTDYRGGRDLPRFVGLWRRSQIASTIHSIRSQVMGGRSD